eukprot:TRINITY_DN8806_c0_g1_i2.p1 TRINITY_DN8806_c0_g1~~TRINITY_DN8806_c0_g1_i2.p1  ORF type:complete len:394 (+),score=14.61 TRINITY_DN8806_c0_g1_i2:262-1443(+)
MDTWRWLWGALALLSALCFAHGFSGSSTVGINYGQIADNLPKPRTVARILVGLKINKVKLYDSNPEILKAFAKTGIELIVGIPNGQVAGLLQTGAALDWVKQNIEPYLTHTKITGLSVGNEVFTGDDTALMANLVPAMQSVHTALLSLGLDSAIKISTAHALSVLGSSYPPSAGAFRADLLQYMKSHLEFLSDTGAPFWINAYPFFAYKDNPKEVSLDYVLFRPNPGMDDPYTRLHYDNMLYAQIDAVYSAIAALGYRNVEVRISETGWPSKGDPDEFGATPEYARTYNRNLILRLLRNQGTPMKPNAVLQGYVFALFNEDQKPGPTSERNYGLLKPDGTAVYNLGLGTAGISATTSLTTFASSAQRKYQRAWLDRSVLLQVLWLIPLFIREY